MQKQNSSISPSTKNNFFKISKNVKDGSVNNHQCFKRTTALPSNLNLTQTKNSQSQLNQFMRKIKTVNHNTIKNSTITADEELQEAGNENKEGIKITQKEIEDCFKILDPKQNGQKVTINELTKKITQMNPNFPTSEVGQLTNNKPELKASDLYEMLKNNQIHDYDPMEEAFQLLSCSENNLDFNKLIGFFKLFGFGSIDKKERGMLEQVLDFNKDGLVNLDDMRCLFEMEREQVYESIKKQLNK